MTSATSPAWCQKCNKLTSAEDLPTADAVIAEIERLHDNQTNELDAELAMMFDQTHEKYLASRLAALKELDRRFRFRKSANRCIECGTTRFEYLRDENHNLREHLPHANCSGTLQLIEISLAIPADYVTLDEDGNRLTVNELSQRSNAHHLRLAAHCHYPAKLMVDLFDKVIAENLTGTTLSDAKQQLIASLREKTGLPLLERDDSSGINCTEIYCDAIGGSPCNLSWRGSIFTSDHRDDGLLVYGAHLFPLLDTFRVYLSRDGEEGDTKPYSFRYLMLTQEDGWKDLGWQVDEFGEFEHWYRQETRKHFKD